MEAKTLQTITQELATYGRMIHEEEIQQVVMLCKEAKRIFVGGAGRSGFCARGFANRLMHLRPYYNKLINDEVDAMMADWLKMMPGETMESLLARADRRMYRSKRAFYDEVAA